MTASAARRHPAPSHTPEHRAAAGAFLRAARIKVGVSQAFLAECLGVSPVMLCHIEQGRHRIPLRYAATLAELLDVPVDHFLAPPITAQDDQEADLLLAFRHLRAEERDALLELVRR